MNTAVVSADIDTVEVAKTIARPLSYYEQKRIRKGKTRRDRESGATHRCISNKSERDGWHNKATNVFPSHTCKGLGNSSKRYKSKAGKIVG